MPKAFSSGERLKLEARLIEIGKRLINRVGVKALTVEDAAREAGLSKGSFYSFYSSKEEFLMAVFESWEKHHKTALLEGIVRGRGDPGQRLRKFFSDALELIGREPGMAKLSLGEIQRLMDKLPAERIAAHQAEDKRTAEEAMRAWVKAGLASPSDVPALPGIFAVLFLIAINRELFPPQSYEPAMKFLTEALADRLIRRGNGKPWKKKNR